MLDAWTAFARTGDPGWPAYRAPARRTMVFDVERRVVAHPRDQAPYLVLALDGPPPGA